MQKIKNRAIDVRVFRLITGEECLCRVESDEPEHYIISSARIFGVNPTSGQGGVMPFMMLNQPSAATKEESNVKLYKKGIMAELVEVSDDLYEKFVKDTSPVILSR